ncbi:hypothetical protein D7V86_11735 [bacterium D16-51]|nr:hypothetical protein D7V96_13590 [bacterium D16-59]RKI59685.1 hypothetical protein D7V86_11735 [bacterium D16-51]
MEDTRHFIYTDKMEFHVLELPKLPKELKDDSDNILLWAKFINAERKEKFEMIATKDPYIASAYQKLQVISQDKQKRLEYEAREKAIRDYNQFMYEADQRGEKRGIEIGEKRGIERINKPNVLLVNDNRFDDLKCSADNPDYQQRLLEEYGI